MRIDIKQYLLQNKGIQERLLDIRTLAEQKRYALVNKENIEIEINDRYKPAYQIAVQKNAGESDYSVFLRNLPESVLEQITTYHVGNGRNINAIYYKGFYSILFAPIVLIFTNLLFWLIGDNSLFVWITWFYIIPLVIFSVFFKAIGLILDWLMQAIFNYNINMILDHITVIKSLLPNYVKEEALIAFDDQISHYGDIVFIPLAIAHILISVMIAEWIIRKISSKADQFVYRVQIDLSKFLKGMQDLE